MTDPGIFDRRADLYRRARPGYPDALWQRLREHGVLAAGRRVLDVGAGTGEAAEVFAREGAQVTALEPGPALAALLHQRLPEVPVVVSTLEEAELAGSAYDVAVAATAFHWADAERGLPALRHALTDDGVLAVWWQVFGDPDVPRSEFRKTVREVTGRRRPRSKRPGGLDTGHWTAVLQTGGLFEVTHHEVFRWSVDLTTQQVHDLFSTFSDWTGAEVDEVAARVDALGGTVTEHYATALYVARPA